MNAPTYALHVMLIRSAKMALAAWERWLESQKAHETEKTT